jgi:hypothetical protein
MRPLVVEDHERHGRPASLGRAIVGWVALGTLGWALIGGAAWAMHAAF